MNKKVERNYLEIHSLNELVESVNLSNESTVHLINPPDFQLNKFFYKEVGQNHRWIDRLTWNEKQWIEYISKKNLRTYVLKEKENLVGYFELIFHEDKNETEIAYLGLLKEYQNKKLGSYLVSSAIKKSFEDGSKRVWLHTCSLDHKNALKNYIARGMTIFKKETITI